MNDQTNIASVKPMRIGRALHMDATRASDEDLERAILTLATYLNETRVSEWTMDKFDMRIDDLTDEQDRRAGVTPAYVERKPIGFEAVAEDDDERFAHADEDEDEDEPASQRVEAYGEDADGREPAFDAEKANREDNGLTPEQEAEALAQADALRETFAETGLVPGLHSAL